MKRAIILLIALLITISAMAEGETKQVLLLGTDDIQRDLTQSAEMSRADAIYVASISDEGIRLLSIERDYRVSLPDQPDNKLATTTFFGGPELCMNSVNELLSLNLNRYVQISKDTVAEAVNILGGVSVPIYEEEKRVLRKAMGYIPKQGDDGLYKLNGKLAVGYLSAREEDIDDIESNARRNDRQQRFLSAVMNIVRSKSLDEAIGIADRVIPLVTTNLTMADIVGMIRTVQTGKGEFRYARSPITEFSHTRAGLHQVIEVNDMTLEIQKVDDFLNK
ncbi:MAG TPA: LCP family protein [Christensenellaceae bacterium]|jgi:LCP family protein required for cell wall assembly|nr:LCP family protein [Christensenellaceae bacterium]